MKICRREYKGKFFLNDSLIKKLFLSVLITVVTFYLVISTTSLILDVNAFNNNYCTECGFAVTSNFCGSCGSPTFINNDGNNPCNISNFGQLLGTYNIGNVLDNHEITLRIIGQKITLWDGDAMIIESYK
ncbi:MAG: hypothetical protein FWF94_03515 [Oscillospiraceae bacterium]|nr:hypothetical protein [Oscillospiraceae bacterium]